MVPIRARGVRSRDDPSARAAIRARRARARDDFGDVAAPRGARWQNPRMPDAAAATPPTDRARRRACGVLGVLGVFAGLPSARGAQAPDPNPSVAVATIVDGTAHVVRGATRHPFGEGTRLRADDIVDVAGGAWARMEFGGGAIVDAGPGSQLMVGPRGVAAHGARAPLVYVLRGSTKLSVAGGAAGIVTPFVEVSEAAGTAVCTVSVAATELFAETGPARGRDRVANVAFTLAPGKCYTAVAVGAGPGMQVDITMVATAPVPIPGFNPQFGSAAGKPTPTGSQSVLGSKNNCIRLALSPMPVQAKYVVTVSKGAGVVAAQLYSK